MTKIELEMCLNALQHSKPDHTGISTADFARVKMDRTHSIIAIKDKLSELNG